MLYFLLKSCIFVNKGIHYMRIQYPIIHSNILIECDVGSKKWIIVWNVIKLWYIFGFRYKTLDSVPRSSTHPQSVTYKKAILKQLWENSILSDYNAPFDTFEAKIGWLFIQKMVFQVAFIVVGPLWSNLVEFTK